MIKLLGFIYLSVFGFKDTNFIENVSSDKNKWFIVNDDVMGGNSKGSITYINNNLIFQGKISLENNGGFSSIRKYVDKIKVNNKKEVILDLKGDGKIYYLRIKSSVNDYYTYTIPFNTSGKWQKIVLKLEDMYCSYRGRKLNISNFNKNSIEEIGFLIGNNNNESFKLEIKNIIIK